MLIECYQKMNQLQNLLHDSLISTSHVDRAALLNKEDYTVKAASVGFQVGEVKKERAFWDYVYNADKNSIFWIERWTK